MNFRRGQKVTLIKKGYGGYPLFAGMGIGCPVPGVVYTVRDITDYPRSVVGLLLEEIPNAKHDFPEGYEEPSFAANEFRPVVSNSRLEELFMCTPNGGEQWDNRRETVRT